MDVQERQKINEALGNSKNMSKFRMATRQVAHDTTDLRKTWRQTQDCTFKRPCNKSICDHCGGGIPHRHSTGLQYIYEQKADPKQARGKSKNFKARSGVWLSKPFLGFPESQCHPFTIDFYLEDRYMDGKASTKRERVKFQSIVKSLMPEAIVRIKCDISSCLVDRKFLFMPEDCKAPSFGDEQLSRVAMNFHGHGIIWHPYLSRFQIGSMLKACYPGEGRVCFSTRKSIETNDDGYLSGGLEGWGEYAGMEKTKVNFAYHDPENDNYAVVRDMMLIRNSWHRSARNISYGDRSDRVSELQRLMSEADEFNVPVDEIEYEDWMFPRGAKPLVTLVTSPSSLTV